MKKISLGILAHVDAGKTTLSEGFLYLGGATSHIGRVDRRDTFLDTHSIERERGITIFSKQAILEYNNTLFTLIDTPGHIDFSCEAERALSVQDYAVLIVSAPDGVTAHTKTLWHLLSARHIPTFVFINKIDISDRSRAQILDELKCILSDRCVDFSSDTTPDFFEACATADESLMPQFFESEKISHEDIASSIKKRRIFPCFFGSALKMRGVEELLSAIDRYAKEKNYPTEMFGAKVYKISRDPQGRRLTFIKVTGGVLKPKDSLEIKDAAGAVYEKVEEIRLYSAERYKSLSYADAGTVCAVTGPTLTKVGMGLGFEPSEEQTLTPVLDYRIIIPKEVNPYETYMKLMVLTEEDPSLSLNYDPARAEIRVRLMGEIQIEVLQRIIRERFGISVSFDEGEILYKETIDGEVYGAGHFEPLRHYAEVHLRLEGLPEGSGIISATECPTDTLSLNWQRLILTHLEERIHKGVLIGAPITDIKITLTAGRAHVKHTEGGDFRQATYRAVRQGLMKSEAVLLEPTFNFRIEVPSENLGRVMNDITNMHGVANPPEFFGNDAVIEGTAPVATIRSYASDIRAFTRGEGKIALTVGPYMPCHNADEVIARRAYDPTLDERNPAGSVFCKAGAGYAVPWYEADALMHITATGETRETPPEEVREVRSSKKQDYRGTIEEDKELMRIFENTYGKIKPRKVSEKTENAAPKEKRAEKARKPVAKGDDYLIIDGYNFIFAVEELTKIAERDFSLARDTLTRMMCDYSAFKKCKVIIVFDAYKRRGGEGSVEEYGDTTVVYTKERQTADAYIEKTTYEIAGKNSVRVVTSDMQEQLIILGIGGLRVSSREFYKELLDTVRLIRETIDYYVKKA